MTLGLNCIFTKGYSDDHNKNDENELQLHCCSVYSSDYYVNVSLGAEFTPKTIGDTYIYMYILQVDAYVLNLFRIKFKKKQLFSSFYMSHLQHLLVQKKTLNR